MLKEVDRTGGGGGAEGGVGGGRVRVGRVAGGITRLCMWALLGTGGLGPVGREGGVSAGDGPLVNVPGEDVLIEKLEWGELPSPLEVVTSC